MSKLIIEIGLSGAAMTDEDTGEPDPLAVAEILDRLSAYLRDGMSVRYLADFGPLHDSNGNRVGTISLTKPHENVSENLHGLTSKKEKINAPAHEPD